MKNFVQKVLTLALMAFVLVSFNAHAEFFAYVLADGAKENPEEGLLSPERQAADALAEAIDGFEYELWTNLGFADFTEEDVAALEGADLIIVGRGIGSGTWNQAARDILNSLTTPMINMNMFSVRPAQLNWFDGSRESYGFASGEGDDYEVWATVNYPEDPVFEGIDLDEDNRFAVWEGQHNALIGGDRGNAKIMISELTGENLEDEVYVYARLEAGVPFFEGGDTPAGYRTYFSFAADNSGGEPYNYFNFTWDGEDVFIAEVERLLDLERPDPIVSIPTAGKVASVSLTPNPAQSVVNVAMANLAKVEVIDLTGKLVLSQNASGNSVALDLNTLVGGVYFVKAVDNAGNASVQKLVKK